MSNTRARKPLRFMHFSTFAPGGPGTARWNDPASLDFDYTDLDDWIRLVRALEEAKFDAIFWADHTSVHDIYKGGWATAVRESTQFPLGDPITLAAALVSSTKHLGLAFSGNIIHQHPYPFARRLSTLDHLSKGRIAWNIVTSFQPSAWRNLGFTDAASHDARYEQAQEYVDVIYKLLEGSWSDDAVVRDAGNGIYAMPERIREIGHDGKYYRVPGIHASEPSPQRTPFLFQAGTSPVGREFSARNAEAIFITPVNPDGARKVVDDMRGRLTAAGRRPSDLLVFAQQAFIIGSTEEEAKAKRREVDELTSSENNLAFMSSLIGADLSTIDVDSPVGDLETEAMQGTVRSLVEGVPDKSWTFRDFVGTLISKSTVGTPEQIADSLEVWQDAGIDGINVNSVTGWGASFEFIEHVVPVLRERGLIQTEYADGTLREKMFAGSESASGPRLNERHRGATFRTLGSQ